MLYKELIRLHFVGGVSGHLVADVTVGIQCEGHRGVAKGCRQRLVIDVALQGQHGAGVTDVMETHLRTVDLRRQCLEMNVQRFESDEHPIVPGKDNIVCIVPGRAGLQLLLCLFSFGLFQDIHHRCCRANGALLVILQRRVHHPAFVRAGRNAHKLAVDPDGSPVKVDAVPGQADELTLPQAGKEIHIVL